MFDIIINKVLHDKYIFDNSICDNRLCDVNLPQDKIDILSIDDIYSLGEYTQLLTEQNINKSHRVLNYNNYPILIAYVESPKGFDILPNFDQLEGRYWKLKEPILLPQCSYILFKHKNIFGAYIIRRFSDYGLLKLQTFTSNKIIHSDIIEIGSC